MINPVNIFKCGQWLFCLWALSAITACSNTNQASLLGSTTPGLDNDYGKSLQAGKEAQRIPPKTEGTQASIQSREMKQTYEDYVKGKASSAPPPVLIPIMGTASQ